MFKVVCLPNAAPIRRFLRRWRLYHPPLARFLEISEGTESSLDVRSREFSDLIGDLQIDGIWKQTGSGRLADLDKWTIPFLMPKIGQPLRMLDVGGSDGSTALDSLTHFRDLGGVVAKATVLESQLRLFFYRRGFFQYFLNSARGPFMVQIGFLGILLEETKAREGILMNPLVRKARKYLRTVSPGDWMEDCGNISLKNPRAGCCADIDWLEQDLFELNPALLKGYDLVRCCNILNRGYFSETRIQEAIKILVQYLKPGGFLLVSRTRTESRERLHEASLWEKRDDVLKHVADFNGGSEIKGLVAGSEPGRILDRNSP